MNESEVDGWPVIKDDVGPMDKERPIVLCYVRQSRLKGGPSKRFLVTMNCTKNAPGNMVSAMFEREGDTRMSDQARNDGRQWSHLKTILKTISYIKRSQGMRLLNSLLNIESHFD